MQFRTIIAAVGAETGLMGIRAEDGTYHLPWKPGMFPEDMQHFVEETKGGIVIMGRKTYKSIPQKFRPLKDRITMVISRDLEYKLPPGDVAATAYGIRGDIASALQFADIHYPDAPIWCAGGPVFCEAFLPYAERMLLTRFAEATVPREGLLGDKLCFPDYAEHVWNKQQISGQATASQKSGIVYWFEEWLRRTP